MHFVTGATGYLGGYALAELLRCSDDPIAVFLRAGDRADAEARLWRQAQLHMSSDAFRGVLPRLHIYCGDLGAPALGLTRQDQQRFHSEVTSVLHIASALNRRSETVCLNINQRGALALGMLAQRLGDRLRRFTYVSTVAVAGTRRDETVTEDDAIDWKRRDYDPYARSKKFAEHMLREVLAGRDVVVLRPSMVLGDSRFGHTTQFDMVRAFVALAAMPVLPFEPSARLDIVNADFVGHALAHLHTAKTLPFDTFHVSAGNQSPTMAAIVDTLEQRIERTPLSRLRQSLQPRPRFAPGLAPFTEGAITTLADRLPRTLSPAFARLMKAFWPYLVYNTVFDNQRITQTLDLAPVPFTDYCNQLYRFARDHDFTYPFAPLPATAKAA